MKKVLTVQTPFGPITRTTDKTTYAYIVCARGESPSYLTRWHAHYVAQILDGVAYRERQLAGTEKVYDFETREQIAAQLVECREWLANADQILSAKLSAADRELVAPFVSVGTTWSSRLPLARKRAEQLRDTYRDVRIFDVATGQEVR
jgi:hypothetical protein